MMEQLEKDWTVYPVLHIDFSISKYMNAGDAALRYQQSLGGMGTNLRM